jgi:hypothetical protein
MDVEQTYASNNTMSDIAIQQGRPDGFRLVSYIDTLAEGTRAQLVAGGVDDLASVIITAEERARDPLAYQSEAFVGAGAIENWVDLP